VGRLSSPWGGSGGKAAGSGQTKGEEVSTSYGIDYYRGLFEKKHTAKPQQRMALVGRENTLKTGLALHLARNDDDIEKGRKVIIFDFDNSASQTVFHVYGDDPNIMILNIFDETDDSIFHEDMSVNWKALIDKTRIFVNLMAEEITANPDDYAAVIFDGGSTYMKWCEFAMTDVLLSRGVIKEEGDSFNQKEWRTRNQLFRDTITRLHGLPVDKVYFTFHLKDDKQYADLGNGSKGLMKVGERPDWVDGTQRIVSQQLFMGRYQKKGDSSAGVYADSSLDADEWVIKARIEEIKGKGMDLVGQDRVILSVKNGKVDFKGLPELRW